MSPFILPNSANANPSIYYKQKVSWTISEQAWNKDDQLFLQLKIAIPGSYNQEFAPDDGWATPFGGCILLKKSLIRFVTFWPKEVDIGKLHTCAIFSMKSNDGGTSVDIKSDRIDKYESPAYKHNIVCVEKIVAVKPENLFDEGRTFTLEADLLVEMIDPEEGISNKQDIFVKDMASIFYDDKNADVLVRVEDQVFKCHKNIISARSEVFKNTLAHDTIESESNTIVVKEIPAKAVEDMLKYIYTGKLPDDPAGLTIDLLNAAELYQIPSLKEACIEKLLDSLDVPSCISTFIMVDRFLPHGGEVRDKVVMFLKCKAEEIVDLEDCRKLVDNYPDLTKELLKILGKKSKEKHSCQFCVVSYN